MRRIALSKRRLLRTSTASLGIVFALLTLTIWLAPPFTYIYGVGLGDRTLKIGSSEGAVATTYQLSFNLSSGGTLGSVVAEFCSNDPLPGTSCVPPGGFSLNGASLSSQGGPGGFSIAGASTSNRLVLSRSAGVVAPGPVSFDLANVVNPTTPGSYYVRLQTYAASNATGLASNDGGIAFAITTVVSITATVPPYLIFCTGITITGLNCTTASGNYIDFGELSTTATRHGTSQMLVATNARSGYNVTLDGTTLTSGNNEILALPGGDVSRPGTGQFGLNLRANSTPAGGADPIGPGVATPQPSYDIPNFYRFGRGDMVVSNPVPDDVRQYTVSYIANISPRQPAGVYVSTITYICLASF